MDRGRGQYEARRSPTTGDWAVVDLLTQTSRYEGPSQADAQRTAGQLSQDNRILDDPREVQVKVGGSWRFGDAKAAQRRDGGWYWYVKPDGRCWGWYEEVDVHEPDGVFAARRR